MGLDGRTRLPCQHLFLPGRTRWLSSGGGQLTDVRLGHQCSPPVFFCLCACMLTPLATPVRWTASAGSRRHAAGGAVRPPLCTARTLYIRHQPAPYGRGRPTTGAPPHPLHPRGVGLPFLACQLGVAFFPPDCPPALVRATRHPPPVGPSAPCPAAPPAAGASRWRPSQGRRSGPFWPPLSRPPPRRPLSHLLHSLPSALPPPGPRHGGRLPTWRRQPPSSTPSPPSTGRPSTTTSPSPSRTRPAGT